MTMKKFGFWLLALLMVGQLAVAQDGRKGQGKGAGQAKHAHDGHSKLSADEKAAKMTERMTKDLGLDEKQRLAVADINRSMTSQMAQLKQEKPAPEQKEARKAKMKELHKQHDEQLRAVLTAEQFSKLQALRAERKEQKHQKH